MATVTNQTQFRAALSASDPEIILANNITLTTYSTISYAVTIRGATTSTSLFWGSPSTSYPTMLVVSQTGILTLESIILDAQNRDGNLVQINGGTLIVNDDTILQNITTTAARNAVRIASNDSTVGGTFIMNGGKVTGITGDLAVYCAGGSFTMNNNAEISNNTATGIGFSQPQGSARGSFTMTGNSRIYGNRPIIQAVGGALILSADMYMGVDEGDAPEIYDNRRVSNGYAGGLVLTDNSTLTMRHNAKIRENYSDYVGGGVTVQESVITMYDNSSITENVCESDYGGGGIRLLQNATLILEDKAHIANNTTTSYGGGVYLQAGSHLEMKGEATLFGNEAENGGGIFVASSTETLKSSLLLGSEDSSPQIYENTASEDGGGINLGSQSSLNLTGHSCIRDNDAKKGKGIYKEGILHVSQSAQVLDGLFFEDIPNNTDITQRTASFSDINIVTKVPENDSPIELEIIEQVAKEEPFVETFESLSIQDPTYTDNVPIITEQLTETAKIQLESSEYVSTPNVPLVIADKGEDTPLLGETDRAAWNIPSEFGSEYDVILNEACNQVLIVHELYNITYCHLYEADNPNPEFYSQDSEFPIVLQAPEERDGYKFVGWHNCMGELINEIPEGTKGDLLLIALWMETPVYRIQYCCLYGADNPNPASYNEDSDFPIVLLAPGERDGYLFTGWYNCEGEQITEILEGTTENLLLIAHWEEKTPIYTIKYCHLYGVYNPNPESYSQNSNFPIRLKKPGKRDGYLFVGWYNCEGQRITEIPNASKGNLLLIALWQKKGDERLCLNFDGNATCVSNVPAPIYTHSGEIITIPTCKPIRKHYRFVSWNTSPHGTGKNYAPNDKIILTDTNITLYALWTKDSCNEDHCTSDTKCHRFGIKWK